MIIGIISGYFNPLHGGHLDYINDSKLRCEKLIVIINNDFQVSLKGSIPFMDELHRKYIIENLKSVDKTMIAVDRDSTVCESLKQLRLKYPDDELIFFNSGDRKQENLDLAECEVCKKLGIKQVVLNQPKVYSSSSLLRKLKNL